MTSKAEAKSPVASPSSSVNGFVYPELFSFPPFFTIQPVQETRKKQLAVWVDLIVSWCNYHKVKTIKVEDSAFTPLFRNAAIDRQLDQDGITEVLNAVQASKYGQWESADKKTFALSPVSYHAIADAIYKYAETYNLLDNVATMEELVSGEESRREIFHSLSPVIVDASLRLLQEQGKAVLIEGSSLGELGVKFLRI